MEEIEGDMYVHVPNDQYDPNHTLVYTISSTSQADTFCNTYNHSNGYNGLKLGQKINIASSIKTYPNTYANSYSSWYIAGFDCEYNHTASDGTIKDNGYGICLVMSNAMYVNGTCFHEFDLSENNKVPYISSTMHTSTLPTVASSLQSTLGSHLANRNVLLSSAANSTGSTSYTWTTAYATLMSIHQLIGYPPSAICNKYDTGEANYFLPLYGYMHYGYGLYECNRDYWTRAVTNETWGAIVYKANPKWQDQSGSNTWDIFNNEPSYFSMLACPLIYIR